ncbi:hypothetical protein GE09DRAFT_1224128 [Coniochaeta sp. 2T2.1]|nr:hypothetical protein GE09DRAFT_1224128 [Coniochaeta sp. 2T2.1]
MPSAFTSINTSGPRGVTPVTSPEPDPACNNMGRLTPQCDECEKHGDDCTLFVDNPVGKDFQDAQQTERGLWSLRLAVVGQEISLACHRAYAELIIREASEGKGIGHQDPDHPDDPNDPDDDNDPQDDTEGGNDEKRAMTTTNNNDNSHTDNNILNNIVLRNSHSNDIHHNVIINNLGPHERPQLPSIDGMFGTYEEWEKKWCEARVYSAT